MNFRRVALAGAVAALVGAAGLFALDRAFPPDLARLQSVGTEVLDRNGRTFAMLPATSGVWRFRTSVDQVSPVFVNLLIRTEDRRFWYHPGVDPISLMRAALQWIRAGHIISGGSTLTMQVVRLLQPRPRTIASKLIEILRAMQLELHFSKRDILGMWLTLAPYGGNLEGVRAGAQAWFGVSPAELDPAQAALLVAIPRRPEALRPDRHAERARRLRDRILASAAGTQMPDRRLPMPRHAPQAMTALAGKPVVRTMLDLSLQEAVERLAAQETANLPPRASLALLIADLRTRDILALYAGAWGDEARAGSLDLTRAIRSPGSAMKPFLYALAFQDGLVSPESWITDLPQHFGGYAPENFDHRLAGRVTAAEALRRSLNLPAVALMRRVGPVRFAATLRAAGARLVLPPGADPSLPLALGGAGITLRDLAGLYAALGADGRAMKLRLLADDPSAPRPFLQAGAAKMVGDVLTEPMPDGGPDGIAWKTGTSWGGRDAWAFGFDARHMAAVWVGRPDGTALPGATGRDLALPVLGRLFGLLPVAPRAQPPPSAGPMPVGRYDPDSLRLLFPPPDAVLSAGGMVTLRAMGGRRPLTFLVDGAPVQGDAVRRQASWSPPGPGFYKLTVLSADGAAARAMVRVK